MMPLMMGFFSLQFSSGLSLYFVISNVVGIVIQYFTPGWVGVSFGQRKKQAPGLKSTSSSPVTTEPAKDSGETSDKTAKKGRRYGKKKRKRRS